MPDGAVIFNTIAIGVPLLAAILAVLNERQARTIGVWAAMVALLASAVLLRASTVKESLSEAVMVLYAFLTLGAMLILPKRDCSGRMVGGILFMLAFTLLAYSTEDLVILLLAWILTVVPFFVGSLFRARSWRPMVGFTLSALSLLLAVTIIAANGNGTSISELKGTGPGGMTAFALLVTAVVFRKGICPGHAWVTDAAETGPAIPTALLFSGHFGALLVARVIVPLFPDAARTLFPVLSDLALVTAIYIAVRALSENAPRKLLALLALSQSACILAGLESGTAEGITGALVHWLVVSISTMGLFGILRLLEVRFGENLTASTHLGLAEHAPRLAVFFVIFGLALVGLPGTLSFCSEDLLIHGTLQSHPQTGVLLPMATAMNAVTILRLFSRLFLGKRRTGFTAMADALPRERFILAVGVLFVVLGGLFPKTIVDMRSAEAETIEHALHSPEQASVGRR